MRKNGKIVISKPKIKIRAVDRVPIVCIFTALAIAFSYLVFTPIAKSAERSFNFQELEVKVWTGDAKTLGNLEREIIREIQINPTSSEAHYLLAQLYLRRYNASPSDMDLLKRASELAEQTVDLEPSSEMGYIVQAQVLDTMGQTENALSLLNPKLLTEVKYGWRKWFLEAKIKADRLDNKTLLTFLKRSLHYSDSQREIIAPYIIAMIQSGNQPSAIESQLRQWNQEFPNKHFLHSLALSIAKQGRYSEAHNIYQQTYSTKMDDTEYLLNDAVILYTRLNKPQKAKTILTHIVENLADKTSDKYLSLARLHLGSIYLKEQKFERAEAEFMKSLLISESRYQTLDEIAKSYRSQKSNHQLVAFIKNINNKIPGSGILYALLGETLSEDLGDHDAALIAFNNAIILEPNRSDFYNGLGLTYYRKNYYQNALKIFTQAAKIDPEDAVSRYNVACVLSKMNRSQEALLSLQEAISLDPRLIETARADSDFQNIRSTSSFVHILNHNRKSVSKTNFAH